jgi:hypothetical protein
MKFKYFALLFFGFIFPQFDINFSYELKYGNGKQATIQDTSSYNYFENLLDVNTSWGNNMYLYTQLEFSDPPVFGKKNHKLNQIISNIFLEYEKNNLSVKLGDLNELYGRGLSYYTMLDQNVDYSNLLKGFSLNYFITDNFKLSFLYGKGKIRFRSNPSFRETNLSVKTSAFISSIEYAHDQIGLINYNFLNQKNEIDPISISIFDGKTEIHDDIDRRLSSDDYLFDVFISYLNDHYIKDTVLVNNHNLNWDFYIGPFDIYIDKAWIDYQKIYGDNVFGSRFYSSVYTDFLDVGITYEYKNYNTPHLIKTLSNPPIVYREGTSILASRNAHAFNFGNEIGHQIDINRNINGINFSGNFSISRKHKNDDLLDYDHFKFIFMKEDSILALYDPFRQLYCETNGWLFSDKIYFKLGADYFIDQKHTTAFTIPTQWILKRDSGNSFTAYIEFQNKLEKQLDQNFIIVSENIYINNYFSASFNRSGKWIVTGFIDRETKNGEIESWLGADFSYNLNSKSQVSLFYGSQKGGLVCANGICAEQPGFEDGFKVTLRSIF